MDSVDSMEFVNLIELAVVVEPESQYGEKAFEAHQQEAAKAMTTDKAIKSVSIKNGKTDSEKVLLN